MTEVFKTIVGMSLTAVYCIGAVIVLRLLLKRLSARRDGLKKAGRGGKAGLFEGAFVTVLCEIRIFGKPCGVWRRRVKASYPQYPFLSKRQDRGGGSTGSAAVRADGRACAESGRQ